jgi:putative aminopeptidase
MGRFEGREAKGAARGRPHSIRRRARRERAQTCIAGFFPVCWLALGLSILAASPAFAQAGNQQSEPLAVDTELQKLVETPSVSGYERALAEEIRNEIAPQEIAIRNGAAKPIQERHAALRPVTDNLGDVIVTIGSGSPHRLLVAPIDEPGFIVSEITPDGYLRVQRLPQNGLPPIFDELYFAQPVKVGTASGQWIDGVVAGSSIHLHNDESGPQKLHGIEDMYVDIGADSAAQVRAAGVDVLSPITIDRELFSLNHSELAGASVGDKFGAAALATLLHEIDPVQVKGTLTVAFVVQQRTGARGLQRILTTGRFDEMIYVGRLVPGGAIRGMKDVHRAPRRDPGSGVLLGLPQTTGTLSGFPAELQNLAAANHILLDPDYSAGLIPASYLPAPAFPARWAHLAIATSWPGTPIEAVSESDLDGLLSLLEAYLHAPRLSRPAQIPAVTAGPLVERRPPTPTDMLADLIETYGASNHEAPVRQEVTRLLPKWAKPETDDAGNLILHLGAAPVGSHTPKILIDAHMDEIGFQVKAIAANGLLDVDLLGGMDLNYYEGQPMLVHASAGDRWGLMELPSGWDQPDFQWPSDPGLAIRVDVGARNPDEVAKLGIKVGDSITIPKKYRPLLGARATGRSMDDRVGDAALLSAVWALGRSIQNRDVTFVWSTGEELGLDGAQALAKRLAAEGRTPDYVFAVDTFVSSDSPLESQRFADAELGKGFVIRAVDNSNIVPRDLVDRVVELARANHIPVQYGATGGGNNGAAFVPYGAVDVALGWPLRYSHSPAEEIDTRDLDSLARIVAAIAKSW